MPPLCWTWFAGPLHHGLLLAAAEVNPLLFAFRESTLPGKLVLLLIFIG